MSEPEGRGTGLRPVPAFEPPGHAGTGQRPVPSAAALLERDDLLATLARLTEAAAQGRGRVVLVGGEPGIGKTSLLQRFAARAPAARVLWGGCEALATPRPFGPLHDFIDATGARLRQAFAAHADRGTLFAALLDELAAPPAPTVLVIDDLHWADAATLDLVKYLGRRIARVPALLVASHRDDAASMAPLRAVFGELPPADVARVAVPRLTPAAVQALADGAGRSAAGVHEATGGNPFFVAEVLAHAGEGVPATVRDAVLARADRLDAAAREVLDLAAVVPRAIELALLEAVLAPAPEAVERCVAAGLLVPEGSSLRFRHELARVAVEEAIGPLRARAWHARVLAALQGPAAACATLAREVHHGHRAQDAQAVLRAAPEAAREAARRGSRREAAAHCRTALAYAGALAPAARARLLDDYAAHCFELGELDAAIPARAEAIALHEQAGDTEALIGALAAHAMPLVRALRNAEADAASRRAVALAETLPPGPARARACATESYLRMLNRDLGDAMAWGERAVAQAEADGATETLVAALTSWGAAKVFVDYAAGMSLLERALALAGTLGDGGAASADAYVMLGTAAGEVQAFGDAQRWLAEGIAFARARDLDRLAGYMEGWQAQVDLARGRWDAAGARANALVARERTGSTNRVTALIALGRLRVRRGDPGAAAVLDEALELAQRSGTLQRLAPVCAARAEAAWIAGDAARVREEVERAYGLALSKGHAWFLGELAWWRSRVAADAGPPLEACAPPWRLQLQGRWRAAADAWDALGCPYERARALAEGDEAACREALDALAALDARPLADRLRARLRAEGAVAVPRGPRASTRTNAAGLTAREREVLALLAEGCRNADIARRLSRSPRTVEHHVEAVLAKLGAATRAEAVDAARALGLL